MNSIYDLNDIEELNIDSSSEYKPADKPVSTFSNLTANAATGFNETATISTYSGQQEALVSTYADAAKKFSEVSGINMPTKYVDIPRTGRVRADNIGDDYVKFLSENAGKLKELKAQGVDVQTYEELQANEAKIYNDLKAETAAKYDNSWSALFGYYTGALGGYVSDPINAASLLVGGAPTKGVGILGNVIRGAATESTIQAGLEVVNKPGEIRARELTGEEISTEQVALESGTNVALAGLGGGIARGLGRYWMGPEEIVKDIASKAPEGITPEDHTAKVLNGARDMAENIDSYRVAAEPSVVDPLTKPLELETIQENTIRDTINSLRVEDIEIPSAYDFDGNVIETKSLRSVLEDAEMDIDISKKINDCLLGG